jgi:hypothetical protein
MTEKWAPSISVIFIREIPVIRGLGLVCGYISFVYFVKSGYALDSPWRCCRWQPKGWTPNADGFSQRRSASFYRIHMRNP